jgi:hypothetical protein
MNFNKAFPQCGHESEGQNREALLSSRRFNVVCLLLLSAGGREGQVIDTIYLSGTLDASFGI